jgi:polyisoprenyl-phosphate glycosyltransferase
LGNLNNQSKISVVIPVYRSADSLEPLVGRLAKTLDSVGREWEVIFIDDCSPDDSWATLKRLKAAYPDRLKIARLLVNQGQHNAILCGFSLVSGDVVVTMDDDLQNPPEEVPKLVAAVDEGFDLVIGAYDSKKHSKSRNAGGGLIDGLQRRIFGLPAEFQLTSFRAVKRTVIESVNRMGAVFPYITCMLFSNASRYRNVPVHHDERQFGHSTYNLKRSLRLAFNLIFHYSPYPLYFVTGLCVISFLLSMGIALWVLSRAAITATEVPGWASIIVTTIFFSSLNLLSLLVFGYYIVRFHQQITRLRTAYSIDELYE